MNPNTQQQINVQLGEKEAEGIYANLALISHSPAEFVLDFTRLLPGVPKTKIYARIIMTPQHAKSFSAALKDNLEKYEKQFGEIKVINAQPGEISRMGFQPETSSIPKEEAKTNP